MPDQSTKSTGAHPITSEGLVMAAEALDAGDRRAAGAERHAAIRRALDDARQRAAALDKVLAMPEIRDRGDMRRLRDELRRQFIAAGDAAARFLDLVDDDLKLREIGTIDFHELGALILAAAGLPTIDHRGEENDHA